MVDIVLLLLLLMMEIVQLQQLPSGMAPVETGRCDMVLPTDALVRMGRDVE